MNTEVVLNAVKETVSKYGWIVREVNGTFELSNRKGKHACTVITKKGGKYMVAGSGGEKLLDGYGQLEKSLDHLLKKFYCCTLVNA